jgi:hypothetical protein
VHEAFDEWERVLEYGLFCVPSSADRHSHASTRKLTTSGRRRSPEVRSAS